MPSMHPTASPTHSRTGGLPALSVAASGHLSLAHLPLRPLPALAIYCSKASYGGPEMRSDLLRVTHQFL